MLTAYPSRRGIKCVVPMLVSTLLYLVIWVILNERSVSSLVIGIFLIIIIQFIRWNFSPRVKYPFNLRIVSYFIWLIGEVLRSALRVVKIIWYNKGEFRPGFYQIETLQNTDAGKVLYANSITLTPGTFTVDISDKGLLVHSLTYQEWDHSMDKKIKEAVRC